MPSVVELNYMAILVAALINMVVGAFWYSPSLFGKEWARLIGRKMEDLKGRGGPGYGVAMIGALIQAYIFAHFISYTGSSTIAEGAVTGFWLWLGFVAVTMAVNTTFAGRSWSLWKIDSGYFLVVLVINGALLAVWS